MNSPHTSKLNYIITHAAVIAAIAASTAAAPADPTPNTVALSASSCARGHVDAAMVTAIPAECPFIAAKYELSGTTLVRIDLASDGTAHNPTIAQSSGFGVLDQAAASAALYQRYTPEVANCSSVGGSYLVRVDFQR